MPVRYGGQSPDRRFCCGAGRVEEGVFTVNAQSFVAKLFARCVGCSAGLLTIFISATLINIVMG